jgi:hypothetical protein
MTNYYVDPCIALTGGGDGALDAIDGNLLNDGCFAITVTSSMTYIHQLDEDNGSAESSPDIVKPDSNAGDKRWVLIHQRFRDGTVGAPGVAFADDLNCGLYRVGADEWALVAGGSAVMYVKKSGSVLRFGYPTGLGGAAPYFEFNTSYDVPALFVNNLFQTGLGDTADLALRRVNGTSGSPTAVLNNEWTGQLYWWPYDGTGYNPGSIYGAAINSDWFDDAAGAGDAGPYNFVVDLNEAAPTDIAVFVEDAASTTMSPANMKTKTTHYTFTYDNGTKALAVTFTAGNFPAVGKIVWAFRRFDWVGTAPFYGRQACLKAISLEAPSQTGRGAVLTFEVAKTGQVVARPRVFINGDSGALIAAGRAVHEGDTAGQGKYYPDRANTSGSARNGCPSGLTPIDWDGDGSLSIPMVDKAVGSAISLREWNALDDGWDVSADLTGHNLVVQTVSGDVKTERWNLANGGSIIPETDKDVKIGDSTHRLTELHSEYVSAVRDSSGAVLNVKNAHASFAAGLIAASATRAASADYSFLKAWSSVDGAADVEFDLVGDGNGKCDGAWSGGGAGYAEYFEWADKNLNREDRTGVTVCLVNGKIAPAADHSREPVIGVVTARPSSVGNAADMRWAGKYMRDPLGRYATQPVEVVSWEEPTKKVVDVERVRLVPVQRKRPKTHPETVVTHETVVEEVDGRLVEKRVSRQTIVQVNDTELREVYAEDGTLLRTIQSPIMEDYEDQVRERYTERVEVERVPVRHSYRVESIPAGVTVPDGARREIIHERVLNPDFDGDAAYAPRSARPEWACVSLLGQEYVRRGQPVGDRWIKMRTVNAEADEWLVR